MILLLPRYSKVASVEPPDLVSEETSNFAPDSGAHFGRRGVMIYSKLTHDTRMDITRAAKLGRRDMFKLAMAATASAKFSDRSIRAQASASHTPHILFIMADQHRGDYLGAQGNPAIRTPNLDNLAKEGVRFRNAYTSTPSCIPARAAILTGLSPWHHGLLGMDGWPIASRYACELPRALHDAGYYTTTLGKNHFTPPREPHGYDRMLVDEHHDIPEIFQSDYHSWFWNAAPNIDDPDGCGLGWKDFWNAYQAAPYPYAEHLHRTRWVGDTAVRFLKTYDRPQPFFLKVSFISPHSPYIPPERLMRQYTDGGVPEAVHGEWCGKFRPRSGPGLDIWHGDLGPDQVRRSRAGYLGEVTFVDEQVGQIIAALDARGWREETLILYAADHGDMLADHYMWRKCQPYQPSVRIPMLMRWPQGLVNAERGQVISQTTELRDLLPTFLHAASAPAPGNLDGRSLLSLVEGKGNDWRPYIDLEHDICYSPTVHWNALTDGHTKYIFHAYDGSEQLFDLDHDPHELHDLASDVGSKAQLDLWRSRMIEHLSERGDAWVKDGKLMVRRSGFPISPHYPSAEARGVVTAPWRHE